MSEAVSAFLATLNLPFLKAVKRWTIEQDSVAPDVVRLTLFASDGESFIVRFVCDGYPELAPRVTFVNVEGSAADRTAWPRGNAAFYEVVKLPPNSFLCTDLTREGFAHHPDWVGRGTAWKGSTHTLLHLFNYIQDDLLNSPNYEGRAA